VIPYGHHEINQGDIDCVDQVLRSDYLTQGPCVPAFEHEVAAKVGAKFAVASNSATSALHLACLALDLHQGDRLWTVPNTFVASANCGRYCGAEVDFVDIDQTSWCMSVGKLREKLIQARFDNRLPKVLVPVHFAGQPTEQEAIWELAKEFGFKVLEDASHSIGATRHGEPVGSCRWSDITVFSFHPVKIITTGEGGMALTNECALADRMAMLRSHGITRDPKRFLGSGAEGGPRECPPAWYYEQQELGYNYRMTDIHAALGISQLKRLESLTSRRAELAARYCEKLQRLPLQLPVLLAGNGSAHHLYVVRLQTATVTKTHRQVFDELRKMGVGVNLHYMPVHLQPYYRKLGFESGQYPEAEIHGNTAITLPLYPTLTEREQDQVIGALKATL
jgi:UDP-4-amino-4,6-dideoxy-N-acetyl-beta-L-altrosamine transaminase